jgi:argininosuccinate lyase
MTKRVEELARQIASLEESDLQTLLDRVEELSLHHNIESLSDQYRKRLAQQGELHEEEAEKILLKLKQIRQEIASREYPG